MNLFGTKYLTALYSARNICTDSRKVKLAVCNTISMAKIHKRKTTSTHESLQNFASPTHLSMHIDTHATMLEMYEGSVLDGLPHLSYANNFSPCCSVIGLLLLIFCQRVTSLAQSYCANRQH